MVGVRVSGFGCRVSGVAHPLPTFRNHDSAGMLLMETMAYVAILAVIINLSLSIFLSVSRLSALGTASLDRLRMVEDFRRIVTADVQQAHAITRSVGAYATGTDQLVLEMPRRPEDPEAARYVVLGHITSTTRPGRLEIIEKNGQYSVESYSIDALPVVALRFAYDEDDPVKARRVSLDVDVPNVAKNKPPATYHVVAALRSVGRAAAGGNTP
jgi:hypothetical protein